MKIFNNFIDNFEIFAQNEVIVKTNASIVIYKWGVDFQKIIISGEL